MSFDGGGFGGGGFGTEPDLVFSDATDYYVNLLIAQYHNQPKAKAHVGALVSEAVASEVDIAVRDGYDIETAVGRQLDVLAKYVGTSRVVVGLDLTHPYFALPSYDDSLPGSLPGFASYDDISVPDFFFTYDDSLHPVYAMNDSELRNLIKFRAITNSSFMSISEIDDALFRFFGANVLMTDNGDMTVTYYHNPADTESLFSILVGTNSLPKPSGVAIIIT